MLTTPAEGASIKDLTIVRGRWIVPGWGPSEVLLENSAIVVSGNTILETGPYREIRDRYPGAAVVGDGTHLLMPGLVNAHSHGRGLSTLRLGIADEPLELRVIAMRASPKVDPYWDTRLACVRQLEAGVTSTMHVDSYYGGSADDYGLKAGQVLAAYSDSGIRFSFALGIRDRNSFVYDVRDGDRSDEPDVFGDLPVEIRDGLADLPRPALKTGDYLAIFESLRAAFSAAALGATMQFAPTNPVWCSDALLRELRDEARSRKIKIHIHLLETPYQYLYSMKKSGRTAVSHLADLDLLGPNLTCAHCVWVTRDDIARLREAGAVAVHNPGSNLRLRSGRAPVHRLLEAGLRIGFGVDSLGIRDGEDLLLEARAAQMIQSSWGIHGPKLQARTALFMATEGGATALGLEGIGRLSPGSPADIVLVRGDVLSEPADGLDGLARQVMQWVTPADIDVVLVGGRTVVENGRYALGDADDIARRALDGVVPAAATDPGFQKRLTELVGDYYSRDWTIRASENLPASLH